MKHKAHISAFEMDLSKDWDSSVYALWAYYSNVRQNDDNASLFSLVRAFLGEVSATLMYVKQSSFQIID